MFFQAEGSSPPKVDSGGEGVAGAPQGAEEAGGAEEALEEGRRC